MESKGGRNQTPTPWLRTPAGLALLAAGCSGTSTGPSSDPAQEFAERGGRYTVSSFVSGARGRVFFTVYLPPGGPTSPTRSNGTSMSWRWGGWGARQNLRGQPAWESPDPRQEKSGPPG